MVIRGGAGGPPPPASPPFEEPADRGKSLSGAVFALALTIAVVLRFWQIDVRPLHHDEGVNWVLLSRLRDHGSYVYDPRNYHGPTLYYLTRPMLSLLGDTELALRGAPALAGVATLAVFWSLRGWLGPVGTPAAALLAAVSPGLTYFSRDFIHETLFGLFTVWLVASAWRYAVTRRPRHLAMTGVAAGLLCATKETAVVVGAVLLGAGMVALLWGGDERGARAQRPRAVWAELRAAFPTAAHPLLAIAPLALVVLALFSAFFTRWQGVADAARAPFIWVGTGLSAQARSWHYYLGLLLKLELPLAVGGVLGGLVALRRRTRFAIFVTVWAAGIALAHSLIPYKMPWLIVGMLLPLAILSGVAAEAAAAAVKGPSRRAVAALGALAILGASGWIAYRVSFVRYDDQLNATGYLPLLGRALHLPAYRSAEYGGYVFSQTDRDLLNLVDAIDRRSDGWATRRGTFIYVTSPDLQPLPWYLRKYARVDYGMDMRRVVPHTIVIASTEQRGAIARVPGISIGAARFRLRPGIDLMVGVRE